MTAYPVRYSTFNIVRRAGIDTSGSIFNKAVKLLAYVDDIDIIARNLETVKDVYTRLKADARWSGLAINTTKTTYMKGSGSKNDDPPCLTSLAVDGDELEKVH